MTQLVLSLFPGIGMLDMAFESVGFCVVRGPDVLWGGDIRRFHPPAGRFSGVIGGPPCQAFSRLAHMVRHNGYEPKFGNLIPEFERCVSEAEPQWFLMENVPDAPVPAIDGYDARSFTLNNRQCLAEDGQPAIQNRVRRWTWGWRGAGRPVLEIDVCIFEASTFEYAATGGRQQIPIALGGSGTRKRTLERHERMQRQGFASGRSARNFKTLCQSQGLPEDFDLPGFTVSEKCRAVGNGVPLPMGLAVAKAVRKAVMT